MNFQQLTDAAGVQVRDIGRTIERYARIEGFLAIVCAATPFLLQSFEPGIRRGSISAYYDMTDAQVFYVPLTIAAMLFIVNGIIKRGHPYNVVLGIALLGVVLFNHDDWSTIHLIFAAIFFGGNALVIVVYTPRDELWLKIALVAVIAVALGCWWFLDAFTLFVAESVSLWIIALHYVLEAWGAIH